MNIPLMPNSPKKETHVFLQLISHLEGATSLTNLQSHIKTTQEVEPTPLV